MQEYIKRLYLDKDKGELDSLFQRLKEIDNEKQVIYDRIDVLIRDKENEDEKNAK